MIKEGPPVWCGVTKWSPRGTAETVSFPFRTVRLLSDCLPNSLAPRQMGRREKRREKQTGSESETEPLASVNMLPPTLFEWKCWANPVRTSSLVQSHCPLCVCVRLWSLVLRAFFLLLIYMFYRLLLTIRAEKTETPSSLWTTRRKRIHSTLTI